MIIIINNFYFYFYYYIIIIIILIIIIIIIIIIVRYTFYSYSLCQNHVSITCPFYLFYCSFIFTFEQLFQLKKLPKLVK